MTTLTFTLLFCCFIKMNKYSVMVTLAVNYTAAGSEVSTMLINPL